MGENSSPAGEREDNVTQWRTLTEIPRYGESREPIVRDTALVDFTEELVADIRRATSDLEEEFAIGVRGPISSGGAMTLPQYNLQQALEALKKQLSEARTEALKTNSGELLLHEVTVEFEIALVDSADGKVGIAIPGFIDLGIGAENSTERRHKVQLTFKNPRAGDLYGADPESE